ncbi:MAG: TIGR03032 family protein [Pseudomonadota bacterium]
MPEAESPSLEINTSSQLTAWLAERKVSFAVTTYQTGKLFLFGLQPDGRLSVFERTLNRTMGMVGDDQTLWISSLYQLWRFENALGQGESHDGYDRLFVPQLGVTTGDIDIHDIGIDRSGEPLFVSTAFSCLAVPSNTHSFRPIWQPSFITKLAGEDRCHLNGLAMREGKPAYVTAVGVSDVADGWRDQREWGGVVIDTSSAEIVCDGLSMPHSPRLHRGELWILNSGTGDLGTVDLENGKFEPKIWLPGYARGLAFVDDFAIVGLSAPRDGSKTFEGLPLNDRMAQKNASPWCAVVVVDLKSLDMVHWLRFEGIVRELYDVAVLPGTRRPMALGFKTDEIRRMLTIEGQPPPG